jgi:hypothetical protein
VVVVTPKPTPVATPRQVPVETPAPTAEPTPDQKVARLLPTVHSTVGDDAPGSNASVAHSMRVETAVAPDRGIFETVIGSLLSFFLG